MQTLGIIPARYASTRFPGKPLADIGGKTMIQRVYEQAQKALPLVYVATDDERIVAAVEAFEGNVIMTSAALRSGTDRCAEAAAKIRLDRNTNFEIVVNIQGDEPFIAPEQLQQLTKCISSPDTQIATLVKPFAPEEDIFHPNSPKVVLNADSEAIYFSRSAIPYVRNAPPEEWSRRAPFYKHVGLYAYRMAVLMQLARLQPSALELAENLEQLRWLENGFKIKVAVTGSPTYAVDTPEDLQRLQSLHLY
jgi:3-deoxy-manno-octulosonate cytidylyltransferase (CMP-KDO synthetase)